MTIKDSTTLKSLETRYKSVETKRKILIKEIEEKQIEASKLKRELGKIKQQIENLKSKDNGKIIITEHALLRYIERVLGINLNELQQRILDESDMKTIRSLGNCTYPKDGFKLKIKDGKVLTVLGKSENV